MRNIININCSNAHCNGVTNIACGCNELILSITPSPNQLHNYLVEVTDYAAVVHTLSPASLTYIPIDQSYWNGSGVMKVRLLSDEGNSDYVVFDCKPFSDNEEAIFKRVNNGFKLSVCSVNDEPVETGYYFTPSVDSNGNLSWTNNGGLENPSTVNIKGPTGATGLTGPQGPTGAAAGFGTPTATVDTNVGTPRVTVTASGENTDKVFNFAFKNLKGVQGDQGPAGPKGDKGDTGPQGIQGPQGDKGATGYYFTPSVDSSGNLSWKNNGNLTNPSTVNIKGPKGDTGSQGATGPTGPTGATGLTGPQGPTGPQGVSVSSVKQTTTSNADGGTNVITVTLSDGKTSTFSVKNGSKGSAAGVTVDSELSSTSTNPVQNKVVKAALDGKASSDHTHTYKLKQYKNTYTATGSVSTIPIGLSYDSSRDTLEVYVNGFRLIEGSEYSVSGTNVVLTLAIDAGAKVHFVVTKIE